jgi:hypothetical protein
MVEKARIEMERSRQVDLASDAVGEHHLVPERAALEL